MALLHLTDENFKKEVLDSVSVVLVDFWAPWCGPCRVIAPIVEDLAKEYNDKMKIGKVDVDQNPRTASQYGIMSIPTLMIFKKGKIVEQVSGALSKSELKRRIEEYL